MGPELLYTEERSLDPLRLELYQPQLEAESVVYDEEWPDIPVWYARHGDKLRVEVGVAPGEVEIVLYGVWAREASLDGRSLTLMPHKGGQLARFRATKPAAVVFLGVG
jgi:hypothetical protein